MVIDLRAGHTQIQSTLSSPDHHHHFIHTLTFISSRAIQAAALFLITGGAVSKRARRRARGIFLNYINDAGAYA